MTPFLIGWLAGIWEMLLESSFLFLVGLILAGLLWYFLSEKDVARLLSRGRGGGVIRAAMVGIPLPLCSCSVLPVATQLRKADPHASDTHLRTFGTLGVLRHGLIDPKVAKCIPKEEAERLRIAALAANRSVDALADAVDKAAAFLNLHD